MWKTEVSSQCDKDPIQTVYLLTTKPMLPHTQDCLTQPGIKVNYLHFIAELPVDGLSYIMLHCSSQHQEGRSVT